MIAVHVENYCPYPVPLKDGLPFTTKGDTDFHGFGTKSIRYAAQKYGGTMQIGQENEMFILNVLLPCRPAKPKGTMISPAPCSKPLGVCFCQKRARFCHFPHKYKKTRYNAAIGIPQNR